MSRTSSFCQTTLLFYNRLLAVEVVVLISMTTRTKSMRSMLANRDHTPIDCLPCHQHEKFAQATLVLPRDTPCSLEISWHFTRSAATVV